MIRAWIDLWNRREPAQVLALIRILVATVLLFDLLEAGVLGIPHVLWAPAGDGGLWLGAETGDVPEMYRWFEPSVTSAWWLHAIMTGSAAAFGLGLLTRLSALVLLLSYAQTAMIMPLADRGIDNLIRCVLAILLFSGAGATWSLDARIGHGRWSRPEAMIPSWPRYLIIVQLVWMYFSAGLHKLQGPWTPLGGSTALFYILQYPHMARFDPSSWIGTAMPLVRLATFATLLFELSAPLMLVALVERPDGRAGRLLALLDRTRFRVVWIATGAAFHLLLAGTMRLGIFPFGVLACYPAFFRPSRRPIATVTAAAAAASNGLSALDGRRNDLVEQPRPRARP